MRASSNSLATRLANALRELYGRKSQKVGHETLTNLLNSLGKDAPASAADAAEPPPADPRKATCLNPGAAQAAAKRRGALALARDAAAHVTQSASSRRGACLSELRDRACLHRVPHGAILEFKPAEFSILEEQREKLVCPRCPEQGVATAPSRR